MSTSMLFCPCSSDDAGAKSNREPLGGIVQNIIGSLSGKGKIGQEEIAGAWEEAAGKSAQRHSKPVAFKKAVLTVNVDGSSWLYELTTKKKDIIKKLEERLKGRKIKDIRLRIGEIK